MLRKDKWSSPCLPLPDFLPFLSFLSIASHFVLLVISDDKQQPWLRSTESLGSSHWPIQSLEVTTSFWRYHSRTSAHSIVPHCSSRCQSLPVLHSAEFQIYRTQRQSTRQPNGSN